MIAIVAEEDGVGQSGGKDPGEEKALDEGHGGRAGQRDQAQERDGGREHPERMLVPRGGVRGVREDRGQECTLNDCPRASDASRRRERDHAERGGDEENLMKHRQQRPPRDPPILGPGTRIGLTKVLDGERLVIVGLPQLLRDQPEPAHRTVRDCRHADLGPAAILLNLHARFGSGLSG